MIKENPLSWIDYDSTIPNIPILERLEAMEEAIEEVSSEIQQGNSEKTLKELKSWIEKT